MFLMNGDKQVLYFNFEDSYLEVLNNDFLPIQLIDAVKTTDISSVDSYRNSLRCIDLFKDFLSGRVLSLSREHAKEILNSVNFPQSMQTSKRLKIVMSCNALSLLDNYWVRDDDDERVFDEVNLRNHRLGDAAYPIALLGRSVIATSEIIKPEISTEGMFPKTWYRGNNKIEMWKTDSTVNNVNTVAEIEVSKILDNSNVNHVKYSGFCQDGKLIAKCELLASNNLSVVNGFAVQDWCTHHNITFLDWVNQSCSEDFAKMCVIDYVLANTDRHFGNIHFWVDNSVNKIVGMTPVFDHNQALIADEFGTDVSDLIYAATNKNMLETAVEYFVTSKLEIDESCLPEGCLARLKKLQAVADSRKN